MGKRYQSDLTDQQWTIIKPLIPTEKEGGRPRTTDMREVMNAIFIRWHRLPMGLKINWLQKIPAGSISAASTIYQIGFPIYSFHGTVWAPLNSNDYPNHGQVGNLIEEKYKFNC